MSKIIIKIGLVVYFSLALLLIFYLLSFNKFGFSQIGDYTIFSLKDDYSLSIVKKDVKKIQINDEIYLYNVYNSKKEIITEKVVQINATNKKETTYRLGNKFYLSSSYLIGRKSDTIKIAFLGIILKSLSQKIVYLSIFIIPVFIYLVYQIKCLNKDFLRRR